MNQVWCATEAVLPCVWNIKIAQVRSKTAFWHLNTVEYIRNGQCVTKCGKIIISTFLKTYLSSSVVLMFEKVLDHKVLKRRLCGPCF